MPSQIDTVVADRDEAERISREVRAQNARAREDSKSKKPVAETKLFLNYNGSGTPTAYRPEYSEDLIEHMRNGNGLESFGAFLSKKYGPEIRPCAATFRNWLKIHQDFLAAKEHGMQLSFHFWEEMGKMGAAGLLRKIKAEHFDPQTGKLVKREYESTNINAQVWTLNMKNKFKWTDRVEHSLGEGQEQAARARQDRFANLMADESVMKQLEEGMRGIIDVTAEPN